jgi:Fe/S biogenesis protein NfuA
MTQQDIQDFIEEEINPALSMHGGYISIDTYEEKAKSLKLSFGGGCHGCPSSIMTMKIGVENSLREKFPDLIEIEDATDHSTGTNPYYTAVE